jgi:iron(II)-dependent oxidoreductase
MLLASPGDSVADSKSDIASQLRRVRRRTHELLEPLSERELTERVTSYLSPPIWDLGHIACYEELWLLQNVDGRAPREPAHAPLYDPFEQPRPVRDSLPLPSVSETWGYARAVREDALELLERVELADHAPLLHDGFVYRMVAQHESQHQETLLQTFELREAHQPYPPAAPSVSERAAPEVDDSESVLVPEGRIPIGSARHEPWDNEHGRHERPLRPFCIDRFPVTNRRFLEFVEDGGYQRRDLWSDAGWAFLQETDACLPQGWRRREGGRYDVLRLGHAVELDPREPVQHVSLYEAEAFARWAGARLPTEAEWEAAAAWDPSTGTARRYPWGDEPITPGRANVFGDAWGPAPVGSYPEGASPCGCEQMLGDVYEWTSSTFEAYPAFEPFPYPEYSEVFFGRGYSVLRGASWCVGPLVARNTYRNWDWPQRRQLFTGFRLAHDPH